MDELLSFGPAEPLRTAFWVWLCFGTGAGFVLGGGLCRTLYEQAGLRPWRSRLALTGAFVGLMVAAVPAWSYRTEVYALRVEARAFTLYSVRHPDGERHDWCELSEARMGATGAKGLKSWTLVLWLGERRLLTPMMRIEDAKALSVRLKGLRDRYCSHSAR